MKKQTTMVIAVALVAVIIVAAAGVMLVGNDSSESDAAIASKLQIRGNANDDHTIDAQDMAILDDILAGKKEKKDYPLADVNGDGDVNNEDKKLLQDLIDRKAGTTVYVLCIDRSGNDTTVPCTYPLRNVVTFATNAQLPALYANGGQYIAGYFSTTYKTAENSINKDATFLDGTERRLSDAAWKNFTTLAGKLNNDIGAFITDYSAVSHITDLRADDLKAAGIPLIIYKSADAKAEITTVLTLGFLFGGECEKMSVDYAQKSWNVFNQIDKKVGGLKDADRSSYISCTMHIYICQNDSTYNTSGINAGGIPYYKLNADFAAKYKGTTSDKMASTEALSNYKDVDTILNNRSIDWCKDADAYKKTIVDTWDHDNKGVSNAVYFKGFEDKLAYINNILPGAVKVAYMAHALYGDTFSREWADGVLKDFIDMGTNPLKGQSLDTVLAYIDVNDYKKALA